MKASKKELFYNNYPNSWNYKISEIETKKRIDVVFDKLLQKTNLKNKRFLEVGSGLGIFSGKAHTLGAKVTGLDIGEKLIEISRKEYPQIKFKVGTLANIPFENNSFDFVLCTQVIRCVDNPMRALEEIKRVTKKNGHIILTTPNKLYKPLIFLLYSTNLSLQPQTRVFEYILRAIYV